MNFFMYSKCGEGLGLLLRLQQEGNNVSACIMEKDYASVYNGILDNSNDPQEGDIIIFDSSGNGARADALRREGFKVFGASKFHDKLENDREFGLSFMEDHGIMIPETCSFTNFSEGIKFIKENKEKRYVFKPSGANLPCKLTYSCSDSEDLLLYMKFVEKNFGKEVEEFVLQEFIEGSIISTEYWVGARGFIRPVNHTIEVKKLMNDDLGPSTGCSGNVVWRGEEDSVLAQSLRAVEEDLVKEGYIGPIDINCIVNEEGIYGLEWTPRFGLDAMPTWLQLIGDVGKIISDSFIKSDKSQEMDLYDYFAGGVRLTIPPYPIEPENIKEIMKNSPNEGIPIRGLEDWELNTYFYEVKRENEILVHSVGTGVIAVISDCGETIKESLDTPYEILEETKIPDKQYRTDLREVLTEMHEDVCDVLESVWC